MAKSQGKTQTIRGIWKGPKGGPHITRWIIRYTDTDLRQWSPGAWALCCHCEDSSDAQCHSGRGSIHVDPEGDPGQNYNEQRGDIHLDQVIAHLTLQVEPHLNASKFTCDKADQCQNTIHWLHVLRRIISNKYGAHLWSYKALFAAFTYSSNPLHPGFTLHGFYGSTK